MKAFAIALCVLALTMVTAAARELPRSVEVLAGAQIEHGGGCRKSSPPGQCCHMKKATGIVHCH